LETVGEFNDTLSDKVTQDLEQAMIQIKKLKEDCIQKEAQLLE